MFRVCITVRGIITKRTVTVKKMIASPKLLNRTMSRNTRELTIGLMTIKLNRKIAAAIIAIPRIIQSLRERRVSISNPLPSQP